MKSILLFAGFFPVFLALVFSGCLCGKKAGGIFIAEGEEFQLSPGQTATLKGKDLKLTFSEVVEDSRCPLYSDCIWEGQVRIKIAVTAPGKQTTLEFIRRGRENGPLVQPFNGWQLSVLSVNPYPEAGKNIKPRDYTVKMLIN